VAIMSELFKLIIAFTISYETNADSDLPGHEWLRPDPFNLAKDCEEMWEGIFIFST